MKKLYNILGILLEKLVVVGGLKPASFWDFHQPRVPKINK